MKAGIVTLLDILGWKGIWQRKSNPEETLDKLIDQIKIYKDKNPKYKNLEAKVISISDTIAITTEGGYVKSLEFHSEISRRIICQSIEDSIPIRGATCYGDFAQKGNVLVGPAIDEVASWYEVADWIGVILTPSALFQVENDHKFLEKYEVPRKKSSPYNTLCCNWIELWENTGKTKKDLVNLFDKMGPITSEIASKYINTLNFYDKFTEK